MVTPSTNPPRFRSSRSAGSHVPGKAVLSKAEAGKRNNIKNLCPILSCHQGVARHCPLGSCRSCSCPWETRPAGGRATRRGCSSQGWHSLFIPQPGRPRESPARQGSAVCTAFCSFPKQTWGGQIQPRSWACPCCRTEQWGAIKPPLMAFSR